MSSNNKFFRKVRKTDGCWEWVGYVNPEGYGTFWGGKLYLAHRYSYELHIGPIGYGLQIDHLCRNRSCVNPSHLESVSMLENIKRGETGVAQLRKEFCPADHKYSPENTRIRPNGHRVCRSCHNTRNRKYRTKERDV